MSQLWKRRNPSASPFSSPALPCSQTAERPAKKLREEELSHHSGSSAPLLTDKESQGEQSSGFATLALKPFEFLKHQRIFEECHFSFYQYGPLSHIKVELISIMFNINPLENLKLYISSRPPLVVFMISVSAMAIAFLTLGYFFKIKEIKSPEMAEDDRSLINLHLMHTSYFLFVMVITMFCYAVIKGRPSKLRQSNPEFCPEKVALADA
ncbi:hypothetical protein MUG91_G69n18 [Manis pentadactyla]|nr:hypothetical protein MUG91_G69n18 [Manis pentadactyla]